MYFCFFNYKKLKECTEKNVIKKLFKKRRNKYRRKKKQSKRDKELKKNKI